MKHYSSPLGLITQSEDPVRPRMQTLQRLSAQFQAQQLAKQPPSVTRIVVIPPKKGLLT